MIPLGTPVRIDLTWYLDAYGHTGENVDRVYASGHNKVGEIHDTWIYDGDTRVYAVKDFDDLIVRAAFRERDLVVL